jgi:hypothetical protein
MSLMSADDYYIESLGYALANALAKFRGLVRVLGKYFVIAEEVNIFAVHLNH